MRDEGRNSVVAQTGEVAQVDCWSGEVRPSDQRIRIERVERERGCKAGDERADREGVPLAA
jgi:hypothetical protein